MVLVLAGLAFVIACTPSYDPPRQSVLEGIGNINVECVNTSTGYECDHVNVVDTEGFNGVEFFELNNKLSEIDDKLDQDCKDAGGILKCYGACGLKYTRLCDLPLEDGGKACTDNSECLSLCLANDRACGSNCEGTCATHRLNACDDPYEIRNGEVYFEGVECD